MLTQNIALKTSQRDNFYSCSDMRNDIYICIMSILTVFYSNQQTSQSNVIKWLPADLSWLFTSPLILQWNFKISNFCNDLKLCARVYPVWNFKMYPDVIVLSIVLMPDSLIGTLFNDLAITVAYGHYVELHGILIISIVHSWIIKLEKLRESLEHCRRCRLEAGQGQSSRMGVAYHFLLHPGQIFPRYIIHLILWKWKHTVSKWII